MVETARTDQVLELAKQEAARFVNEHDHSITEDERARVWAWVRSSWQRRYGLVEAG